MTQRNESPKAYIKWTWAEAERIAAAACALRRRTDPRLNGWTPFIREAMQSELPPERWRALKQVKTLTRVLDAIGELHEAQRERPIRLDDRTIEAIVKGLAERGIKLTHEEDDLK